MTQTKAVLPPEFTPVYKYTMRNGKVEDPEVLDKKLWRLRCVVYARVCGDEIVYVGKTDGTLCGRILAHKRGISVDQPKNPMTQKYRMWAEGRAITIYAYKPEPIRICGHVVEVHAGLEAALIKALKPQFVARI